MEYRPHVVEVLHRHGVVEPEQRGELPFRLRVEVSRPGQQLGRVAGQHVEEHEVEGEDDVQGQEQGRYLASQVATGHSETWRPM